MTDPANKEPEPLPLDAKSQPTRIEFELTDSAHQKLLQRSAETGRPINDVILDLLNKALGSC